MQCSWLSQRLGSSQVSLAYCVADQITARWFIGRRKKSPTIPRTHKSDEWCEETLTCAEYLCIIHDSSVRRYECCSQALGYLIFRTGSRESVLWERCVTRKQATRHTLWTTTQRPQRRPRHCQSRLTPSTSVRIVGSLHYQSTCINIWRLFTALVTSRPFNATFVLSSSLKRATWRDTCLAFTA